MTHPEFVNSFGSVAATMSELPEFKALLETAREENPYLNNVQVGIDPTSVVRNSGRADGWAACLAFLKNAHRPPSKPDPKQFEIRYQDPQTTFQSNPNSK